MADKTSKTGIRESFSKLVANHQLAWDSTSLGALKTCPRYYYYNIVCGYVSSYESIHLRFGSEYNNALVTFHKARATGLDYEASVLVAVRYALEHTWNLTLNRPWTSDEPTKNRETLIRTVIWYLDHFKDDVLETYILASGEPAVELSFVMDLGIYSGLSDEPYVACGYLDRLVTFMDRPWVTDWKTTKSALDQRYFAQYSPNNQVSQYSTAGGIITGEPIGGLIIDAAQLGVTFSRFQRSQISRTKPQLEEWMRSSLVTIQQNERYVEDDFWPMNETACSNYGGCPYREVCGSTPEIRPRLLDGLFHKRMWDPLVVREI
jgi:hypothetical protein